MHVSSEIHRKVIRHVCVIIVIIIHIYYYNDIMHGLGLVDILAVTVISLSKVHVALPTDGLLIHTRIAGNRWSSLCTKIDFDIPQKLNACAY